MSKKTALFVDDESAVLSSVKRLFRGEACNILTVESAEEALRLLECKPINLIVSDQRMPAMEGIELLTVVREKYPFTLRVIMSGYADITAVIEAVNKAHIYKFISKPWDSKEFKQTILDCLHLAPPQHTDPQINTELIAHLQETVRHQESVIRELKNKLDE